MRPESPRCLFISTSVLEIESPRAFREILTLLSKHIGVYTLEPVVVYLAGGHSRVYMAQRAGKKIPRTVKRAFTPFFTLPAAHWLTLRRLVVPFVAVEPLLLALNLLIMTVKLAYIVKVTHPDFVLVHGPPDTGAIVTRMVSRMFKLPYVWESRDPGPIAYSELVRSLSPALAGICERGLDILEAFAAKGARHVIVVNKWMGARLARKYGVGNWVPLYGSTLGSMLSGKPIETKDARNSLCLRIVVSGSLTTTVYDFRTLMRAMKQMANDGYQVRLKIVGTIEDELLAQLSASSHVDVMGWANWDRYVEILTTECDVGLIPLPATRKEDSATPNKLFDYMAAGLPVVGTALPGLMEVVKHGTNGLLYKPESSESLYSSLVKLYDADLRIRLGREALREFKSLYCQEVQMAKFMSITTSMLE